jgi:cytochrome c peroxidase
MSLPANSRGGFFFIMNKNTKLILPLILGLAIMFLGVKCTDRQKSSLQVKALFDKQLDSLQNVVQQQLLPAVEKRDYTTIKKNFIAARSQYKKLEYYMEYFFPTTAVMINGAPIDEIELGENMVKQPMGFQVMEELVYGEPNNESHTEMLNEIKKMGVNLKRVSRYNKEYEITDAQIFDAVRLEIFRITSLGITGFDTPAALQSLPEAAAALESVKSAVGCYTDQKEISEQISRAIDVTKSSSFDSFDRLSFITNHLQPISKAIDDLRKTKNVETVAGSSAMRVDATGLFEQNAININNFVANATAHQSKEKIALGGILFNSTVLSATGTKSCASCHNADKAFTDGLPKAAGIRDIISGKDVILLRNTPTLTYAGFQRGFFYDLKAGTLEDQALDVVHHKQEMNGSLKEASKRINDKGDLKPAIKAAYGVGSEQATPWRIQHALASYIRSLAPFNSRLDQYMRGDHKKLNNEEKDGFNIFMGKAKCGSCHFAPLFNGTQSPLFGKSEAEVLGVPAKADTSNAKIDSDLGRFAISPYPQYKYAFKTTTLRNVSKTAPYMHNGVYKTLEEVLSFYNRGGGAGIGIKLDNQTLAPEPLNLTNREIKSVIAFLKTLDDE